MLMQPLRSHEQLREIKLADIGPCDNLCDMIRGLYDMSPQKYPEPTEPASIMWPPSPHFQADTPPPHLHSPADFQLVFAPRLVRAAFDHYEAANQDILKSKFDEEGKEEWASYESGRLSSVAKATSCILQPVPRSRVDPERYYTAMFAVVDQCGVTVPLPYTFLDARGQTTVDGAVKKGPLPACAFMTWKKTIARSFVHFLFMEHLDVCEEIQALAASGLNVTEATLASISAKAAGQRPKACAVGRRNKAISILCWVLQEAYELNTPYVLVTNCFKNIWFHIENGSTHVGPTMTPTQPTKDGSPPFELGLLHALLAMTHAAVLATINNPENCSCILKGTGTQTQGINARFNSANNSGDEVRAYPIVAILCSTPLRFSTCPSRMRLVPIQAKTKRKHGPATRSSAIKDQVSKPAAGTRRTRKLRCSGDTSLKSKLPSMQPS